MEASHPTLWQLRQNSSQGCGRLYSPRTRLCDKSHSHGGDGPAKKKAVLNDAEVSESLGEVLGHRRVAWAPFK